MNLIPMGEKIIVKPEVETKDILEGSVIPPRPLGEPLVGKVVSSCNSVDHVSMSLVFKPGYKVLYGKYVGYTVEDNGERYLIMNESDILAIVPPSDSDSQEGKVL